MTDIYLNNWIKKADNDLKIVEHELEEREDYGTAQKPYSVVNIFPNYNRDKIY